MATNSNPWVKGSKLNVASVFLGVLALVLSVIPAAYAASSSSASSSLAAGALSLTQTPLFVGQNAKPVVMLAMSRDQELYHKAYPDYSNLDGGALRLADTTYRNDFDYAGYFDPKMCYAYVADVVTAGNSYFSPAAVAVDHKCSSQWSGNFLNWAAMTRMDILRKVLYGGKRSVDTAQSATLPAKTILERAYIPQESHAFAKVFKGIAADSAKGLAAITVSDLTPYSDAAITLCNVSTGSGALDYPLIRVAKGDWRQWSHTEEQQCQYRGVGGTLGVGRTTSPSIVVDKLADFVAKVSVCVPDVVTTEDGVTTTVTNDASINEYNESSNTSGRCKSYEEGSYKPIGLLQKFYKDVNFGLVTGTWANPGTGGVLRKKASQLAGNATDTDNEFSDTTGVFNAAVMTSTTASGITGIIKTIDSFRIPNSSYSYTAASGMVAYSNSSDWRNPIGEIYAEALRYLLGKSAPTSGFDADDSGKISGITRVTTWNDPVPSTSWCSKCSIVVISSGPNTFDNDNIDPTQISGGTTASPGPSLTASALDTYTDTIGLKELGLNGVSANVFYGGSDVNNQCTVQALKLSGLLGKCPEAPMSKGVYDIAGLAHWAHTVDQRTGTAYQGKQVVSTYAVELSEGLPNLEIPVDGKTVSFVPVCTSGGSAVNNKRCSLVGVEVESLAADGSSGSYLFYWEDQDQETGWWDYDMDAVQRMSYCVGAACSPAVAAGQVKITNSLPYWATGTYSMHMHYIISGTTATSAGQPDEAVFRNGDVAHNLGYSTLTDRPTKWHNSIAPQGVDPIPANNLKGATNTTTADTAVYTKTKLFTATTGTVKQPKTPLYYAAKYGSFVDTDADTYPNLVTEWDVTNLHGTAGADGIPDGYFMMKNPSLLEDRLHDIFAKASKEEASGSGVSTNSTKLDTDSRVYQARFYAGEWFGELRSLKVGTSANQSYDDEWTTLDLSLNPDTRKILSYNGTIGIDFTYASLSATQKTALGGGTIASKVVDWVRGKAVTGYRSRVTEKKGLQLLGDIVNSTPVYAGITGQGYEKLHADYGSASYANFVSTTKASRAAAVYVGANDGMLHAFNALNGAELFAYVPSMIYSKLPIIASATYGTSTAHTYTVDGPIAVGDAYLSGWKTVLVGTLGAGGRGIFALDVTNPANPSLLFELTETDYPELGNVMGKPLIAPVGGRWKVIFGNGYNGSGYKASLFVIDLLAPKNATYSKVVSTGTATNIGLGAPAALQNTTTGAIDYVYAGDLAGHMWKFDLRGTATASWDIALNGGKFLFHAKDSDNNSQPIFAAPTLGKNSNLTNATMVYFGTGKYIESSDVGTTQMARVQAFYGLADEGSQLALNDLQEKTMTVTSTTRDVNDLGSNAVAVNWASKKGWHLNFPAGERMVSKSLMLYDRLLFSTIVPNTDVCSFGGAGWLMELVGVGDLFGTTQELLPTNGVYLNYFLPGDLTRMKGDSGTVLNESNIKGDIKGTVLNDPDTTADGTGRVSWRQLR